MAFGDRKAWIVGATCAAAPCGRPAYVDGLCAACYRGQTDAQRRVNHDTYTPEIKTVQGLLDILLND